MALIAHWPLNGDLNDYAGGSNLEYVYNSGKLNVDDFGKIGRCYKRAAALDGTDYFGTSKNFNLQGSFTMACWAFVTSCHAGTANGLVTNHNHATNSGAGITVKYISADDFRVSCNTGTGSSRTYHSYYGTTNIKDAWHHLIVRYDAHTNNLSLWVDGTNEMELTYAMYCKEDPVALFAWSLGTLTWTSYRPGSSLNDVRIYDHALSLAEVKEIAKAKVLHLRAEDMLEPTENVVTNTDLNTGWSQGYQTNIVFDEIPPPLGVDSPTVGHDRGNSAGYWYSYGNYAPQVPGQIYTVSMYVKTRDSNFAISYYTADNSEVGRVSGPKISVPNDGNWHRIVWPAFTNPSNSVSESLSFNFTYAGAIGDPSTRTWFCAPQMEPKDHATPFTQGKRVGRWPDRSPFRNDVWKQAVTWQASNGVYLNGPTAMKNTGSSSWDAGAYAYERFLGDCYVEIEFDLESPNKDATMVGFSTGFSTWSHSDIRYAVYFNHNHSVSGNVYVYELGASQGAFALSGYNTTNRGVFRIEVVGSTVSYLWNGNVFKTTAATHGSSPLFVKTSQHCYGYENTVVVRAGHLGSNPKLPVPVEIESPVGGKAILMDWGKPVQVLVKTLGDLSSCTISFWRKRTAAGSWLPFNSSGTGSGSYIMATSGGTGAFYHSGVSGALTIYVDGVQRTTPINDDEWHHYCIVDVNISSWSEFWIGAYQQGEADTWLFRGYMDDFRIYATALSADDVAGLARRRVSLDVDGNLGADIKIYQNWVPDIYNHNLVENGDMNYGNADKIEGFTYDATRNLFYRESGSSTTAFGNYIPIIGNGVDKWDQYKLEADVMGENVASRYYFMILCYDKYFRLIRHWDVAYYANTATTLTADLKSGDEYVYLSDISNWYDNGVDAYHHAKTVALWHPDDDPLYKPYRYTKRATTVRFVDKPNNRLRLNGVYSGDTIPAGSPAQNHYSGGSYSYIGASNALTSLTEWDHRSATTSITPSVGSMRYGSSYVKIGFLINRNATGPTTLVRNIRFYNITNPQTPVFDFHKTSLVQGAIETNALSENGPTDGLVGFWTFDGHVRDESRYFNGATTSTIAYAPGIKGSAADCTGGNVYIPNSPSLQVVGELTICFWIYVKSYSSRRTLINKAYGGEYTVNLETSGNLNIYRGLGGGNASPYSSIQTPVSIGVWTFACVRFDGGGGGEWLINGVSTVTGSSANLVGSASSGGVNIGTGYTGGNADVILDQVRIYNVRLSDAEIQTLYDLERPDGPPMKLSENVVYLKGEIKEV